jgi:hypothetical protein
MKIIGYHGTSYDASKNIIEKGYVFSKENEWLGAGYIFLKIPLLRHVPDLMRLNVGQDL